MQQKVTFRPKQWRNQTPNGQNFVTDRTFVKIVEWAHWGLIVNSLWDSQIPGNQPHAFSTPNPSGRGYEHRKIRLCLSSGAFIIQETFKYNARKRTRLIGKSFGLFLDSSPCLQKANCFLQPLWVFNSIVWSNGMFK